MKYRKIKTAKKEEDICVAVMEIYLVQNTFFLMMQRNGTYIENVIKENDSSVFWES